MGISNFLLNSELVMGEGALELIGGKCADFGKKALLICAEEPPFEGICRKIESRLEAASVAYRYFRGVKPNPRSGDIEEGAELLKRWGADVILSIGGGSAVDTGKAISLFALKGGEGWDALFAAHGDFSSTRRDLRGLTPSLAVPTTAGTGAHLTQAAVITYNGEKRTLYHPQLKPRIAFLDRETQKEMPLSLRRVTGFDALTHAFESYLGKGSHPLSRSLSIGALRLIMATLPQETFAGEEVDKLIAADSMAGLALSIGGAGIPHPLSELLGSMRPLAHGACLAVFYPAYLDHLMEEAHPLFPQMAAEMGYPSAEALREALLAFLDRIGLKQTMRDLGFSREEKEALLRHPLVGALPWAGKEAVQTIIEKSY